MMIIKNAMSKEYYREYYQKNKKHIAEVKRIWKRNNPDKMSAYKPKQLGYVRAYRKRLREAEGFHTDFEWEFIKRVMYRNTCPCCGKKKKLDKDHVQSPLKGGTNFAWNLQPLCHRCNSAKGNQTIRFAPII